MKRKMAGAAIAALVVAGLAAPAAAAETVISEDFTDGPGGFEPALGGTWGVVDGAYVLSQPANGDILGNLSLHKTKLVGDFSLTADVTITSAGSSFNDAAVVFGYQDPQNYYLVSLNENNDSGTNGIFHVKDGVKLPELVDFPTLVPTGVKHVVEVHLTGDAVTVRMDGADLGATTLDALPVLGQVGFGSKNDSATFDNLAVDGTVLNDTQPPSVPGGLTVTSPYPTEAALTWQDSTDDVAVAGYQVWRNGTKIADAGGTSYKDGDLTPSSAYSYTVRAYDESGNVSADSQPATVRTANPDKQAPSRPKGVTAKSHTQSQATLTWHAATDNYGVTGYRVYRNGIKIAGVDALTYTDSGLRAGTRYTYQVRAQDRAGNLSAPSVAALTRTPTTGPAVPYRQGLIDSAMAEPLTAYQLNEEWLETTQRSATAMYFLTAAASYEPTYRSSSSVPVADRVVEHIRNLVNVSGNEPGCSGGLDTISTNFAIQSFTLAKDVPQIWDQLTTQEKHKVTLLAKACLVASHFLHDDGNPGTTGINQLGNTGKTWNANHVEGGIGMGLAASYFLGGADQANAFLTSFQAGPFLQELQAAGFTSTYWVFSQTPAADLEAATNREYVFNGHTLDDPFGWIAYRAQKTYNNAVAATGANGKGYLVSGADGLPNLGETGMEQEFESSDANGKRSDLRYVSLGWNNSLVNLWLVEHFGDAPTGAAGDDTLRRYTVGTTDFLYKADRGYHSWSLGTDRGVYTAADLDGLMGLDWLRELAGTLLPVE